MAKEDTQRAHCEAKAEPEASATKRPLLTRVQSTSVLEDTSAPQPKKKLRRTKAHIKKSDSAEGTGASAPSNAMTEKPGAKSEQEASMSQCVQDCLSRSSTADTLAAAKASPPSTTHANPADTKPAAVKKPTKETPAKALPDPPAPPTPEGDESSGSSDESEEDSEEREERERQDKVAKAKREAHARYMRFSRSLSSFSTNLFLGG